MATLQTTPHNRGVECQRSGFPTRLAFLDLITPYVPYIQRDAPDPSISLHRVVLPQRRTLKYPTLELHGALGGLLVISAYKPPQPYKLLSNALEVVSGAQRRLVLAGVLNCKHPNWGSDWRTKTGTS